MAVLRQNKTQYCYWVFFFGASERNRTAISTLARLYTNRCTTPAYRQILTLFIRNSKKKVWKMLVFQDYIINIDWNRLFWYNYYTKKGLFWKREFRLLSKRIVKVDKQLITEYIIAYFTTKIIIKRKNVK